jgi:hypothetical protein
VTFADIAGELGVDESTARRIVDGVLEKLQRTYAGTDHQPELVAATIAVVLRERAANDSSSAMSFPRRFRDSSGESAQHAERATHRRPSPGDRRARHAVPRRFKGSHHDQ